MIAALTVTATAASIFFVVLLALGDPKRRRANALPNSLGKAKRHAYLMGAIIPGMLIAISGDAAMWLIWFGGCAVAGWLIALWLASPSSQRS
ncbi:hypothetical protein BV98_003347 [Sphingobium herbicidovorans NBRC 16415]|uniref:Uncharacterized protein n=1 Tax=Sphingobium herbicidovorans (strain ATCC 700291 / DSM 11019 / CCUG 56400 / KCTC 2939 / LMG 18315 / NBRC 16415 / MH) TaxID=1219045 RepID=A0A086P6C9_SPHHM|nr:hypothetical protein [Sphingobium herbicidovorans]KFG88947.1 hypothetical protein BV98_003347 [Sphingobium herbicidovorans NBRC 16415]